MRRSEDRLGPRRDDLGRVKARYVLPIQRLTELNLILANSMAAMDRIFEVFDTYPAVQERSGALSLPRVRGDLCFEHVSFRYDGREPVLERVDLRIPAGSGTW